MCYFRIRDFKVEIFLLKQRPGREQIYCIYIIWVMGYHLSYYKLGVYFSALLYLNGIFSLYSSGS